MRNRPIPGLYWVVIWLGFGWCAKAETNVFPPFQLDSAREYLRSVCELYQNQSGTNAEALFLRANLLRELGQAKEAEAAARQALESEPNRPDIEYFLANLYIKEDRMDEAAACLRKAVDTRPAIPVRYQKLGMVLDRLGDSAGAEAAFTNAVRLAPGDGTSRLLFGKFLLDRGRAEEAVPQLERACELDPKSPNPAYTLYQAQTKLGQQDAAQKTLEAFRRLKKTENDAMSAAVAGSDLEAYQRMAADFHYRAGVLFLQEGNETLAESHWRQAIKVATESSQAYESLGSLLMKQGRLAEARGCYEALVKLHPEDPVPGVNLGNLLLQLKDLPAAVAELKRVLELDPKQPGALNNLARFYLGARRDLPEALDLSRRLVAVEPRASHYDLLGWAYYANGRTNEAVTACAQAVELEPGNSIYQEHYRRIKAAGGILNPAFAQPNSAKSQ